MRVTTLMRLALLFIKNRCRVNLIFDGEQRHHTKRATTKRKVDSLKNRIDIQILKCELSMIMNNQLELDTEEGKNERDNQIDDLKKKIRTIQKQNSETVVDVGKILVDHVKKEIDRLQESHECAEIHKVLTCVVAEFQADLVIAKSTMDGYGR
jgi:diphthamide synthase (EF-2-diphthine--ammonia ligase)